MKEGRVYSAKDSQDLIKTNLGIMYAIQYIRQFKHSFKKVFERGQNLFLFSSLAGMKA